MSRWRKIKRYGNSIIILLSKNDLKDLNIEPGDLMDIEDVQIKKSKRNRVK